MSRDTTIENSRSLLVTIAQFLDSQRIPYLVDGGTLLGIVRDGDLIPYDTDLDIALFDHGVEKVLASRDRLAELEIAVRASTYRGKPYVVSFGWRNRRNLALHAHVFTRSPGGFFWCPQVVKHFRWPGTVGAIRAGRRHAKRIADGNGAKAPHLSDWHEMVWSRVGLPSFPLYTLGRLLMRALGRVDRQSWVDSFPGRALYTCFTWIVPAPFFESVEEVEWHGKSLRIPARAGGYLAYKYGDDWQQKKPDWVFFLDDHSMYFGGPETVVPRLEQVQSSVSVAVSERR